jgi:hypothetical protein
MNPVEPVAFEMQLDCEGSSSEVVLSDAGQQEADPDQHKQAHHKSDGCLSESRRQYRSKGRSCDLCLLHGNCFQYIQLK